MKLVLLALLALAVAASAVEFTSETSHAEVVSALDELRNQIATHGIESLYMETASTVDADSAVDTTSDADADSDAEADSERRKGKGKRSKRSKVARSKVPHPPGIGISFKWSNVDVRNFLAWLVDQKPETGALSSMQMKSFKGFSGKVQKKLSAKMRKMLKKLRALKRLPTAGHHGGLWWYKVQCPGVCNSGHILQACHKYRLKPACDHTAYSDGKCLNSGKFNHGRHLSHPSHALEGWQNNFFPHTYIYAAMANGGNSLQNTGSSHRWASEHGNTVCVTPVKPKFSLLKKYRNRK